jgi:RNA polymerase sigma factor (TIGR02999 family)
MNDRLEADGQFAKRDEQPDALFDQLYEDLRRIARRQMAGERLSHTLQPTALVNEAYLRLASSKALNLNDRAHFLRLAVTTMRRILVDHARTKLAAKRGATVTRVTLTDSRIADPQEPSFDLIALDAAIDKLSKQSERQATIIDLRFFAGLSVEETASELSISAKTVKNETRVAKAWLRRELS